MMEFLTDLALCSVMFFFTKKAGHERDWSKGKIWAVYMIGALSALLFLDALRGELPW